MNIYVNFCTIVFKILLLSIDNVTLTIYSPAFLEGILSIIISLINKLFFVNKSSPSYIFIFKTFWLSYVVVKYSVNEYGIIVFFFIKICVISSL